MLCDVGEEVAELVESKTSLRLAPDGSTSASAVAARPPPLKKTLSIHQITLPSSQKYLELIKLQLQTADNLAPLPMSMGWVREGLLVVGMDNEMHCYTQWTDCSDHDPSHNKLLSFLQLKPTNASTNPAHALLYGDGKGMSPTIT